MIFDFDNISKEHKSNIEIGCVNSINYIYINIIYKDINIRLHYKNNSLKSDKIFNNTYNNKYKLFTTDLNIFIDNSINLEKFSDFCNTIFKYIDSYINNLIFI